MPQYVEFEMEDGGMVIFEVEEQPLIEGGLLEAARPDIGIVVEKAGKTFDESVDQVRRAASLIVNKLRDLSDPADEMEVTFGLKASGELGNIVIGKGSVEAHYTVKLKWTGPKKETQ
ncbi:MAG TPA: hypothetical protein EYP41_22495 [Anaerolineae bacterium]|nr:hypothetical protein [Anaerolineae bacterium]HIP71946.1 hypothetical protein [Anaerolineae bacterium]